MYFYPRPLRGGRPFRDRQVNGFDVISIHALCEEGDLLIRCIKQISSTFLSTPSARRATVKPPVCSTAAFYFYPRPLRGGRRRKLPQLDKAKAISIHALCEEGDPKGNGHGLLPERFLSTPSARRATNYLAGPIGDFLISIHALCEEGDMRPPSASRTSSISIHALCEEGDISIFGSAMDDMKFLSTPSARRATGIGSKG